MKRAPILISTALLVALTAGGAALSAAAAAPDGRRAHSAATLPPQLVALERRMDGLKLSSARISERASRSGHAKIFVIKGSTFAQGGLVERIAVGAGFSAVVETSASPSVEVRRLGETPQVERRIGTVSYLDEPSLAKQDGGRPWLVESQQTLTANVGGALIEAGPDGVLRWLQATLEDAKSATLIGSGTVDGASAKEFVVSLDAARYYFRSLARSTVTMRVWFERSGLPVKITVDTRLRDKGVQFSPDTLHATIRYLATEVPVSVSPPPAAETITEAEAREILPENEVQEGSVEVEGKRSK